MQHSHWIPGLVAAVVLAGSISAARELDHRAHVLLEEYCFDCHDEESKKGGLDMAGLLASDRIDRALVFENLVTGKMPPANKKRPNAEERNEILTWLAEGHAPAAPNTFRRISRHEFVHSVNDLLGTNLDISDRIPEDRGTKDFDSDRRIQLSREMLGAYFSIADEMLEFAFPEEGVPSEQVWVTNTLKDSHETYNIYLKPYLEGTLFSWTRANNGNSYSFFYDRFDPPVAGWYDLTFDAMKVGGFPEDITIQVHAGKYYYADDRPQPQRLLGVISLGNRELQSHTVRAFLHPGENVSVHCFSRHTFRKKAPEEGAYIKQLEVRGPVFDQWPPASYQSVFTGQAVTAEPRKVTEAATFHTNLRRIGGTLTVSSFEAGMEKDKMQDGSNRTFWHTRFTPTVAKPPHYVIVENPRRAQIEGLSYATWSGGNGNGQVRGYKIQLSEDGTNWSEPIAEGTLEVRLANEQPIGFAEPTTSPFIRFLVTNAVSLDGKSLASIGKLDVIVAGEEAHPRTAIVVSTSSTSDLKAILRQFGRRAFCAPLSDEELAPYYEVALAELDEHGDFVRATKLGLKAILCSPRFLMAPGEHPNRSYARAADLARILWLSVPDEELLAAAEAGTLSGDILRAQITRMIADRKSSRMVRSFCDQWLNLRSFRKVTPSLKLYPRYDDLLDHYLPMETRTYLAHLIRENLPVGNLIDSDFAFLNQRLAQHYGIEGVLGQELRKVALAPEVPRGGLLTMGSVLKVTTDGHETSPILRGAWISKNIVGNPLSPPPENVTAIEPDHGKAAVTLREQIEQHKVNKTCYACHKSIDPYGFALESFDATGQWRTRYRVKQAHRGTFQYRMQGYFRMGGDVDAAGEIGESAFEDVFGLKKLLLSDHRKIAYNFAKKVFEYANGYEPGLEERLDLLEMIGPDPEDCRMKDLVAEVLLYSLREGQP